jgi:hypothetical protein
MMHWQSEEGEETIRTRRDLARRVASLDPDTNPFAVLSRGGTHFIQAAAQGRGFVIEKRDEGGRGISHAHKTGRSREGSAPRPTKSGFLQKLFGSRPAPEPVGHIFTREEVGAVFTAWYEGEPDPPFLRWETAG